jgi:hypothetical protein
MRRRASIGVAAAAVLLLTVSAAASAAPTIKLKGEAVPIPGYRNTGNIYGAGAAVKSEVTISGTEYGGFPAPLIGVNVFLPKYVVLHPAGFPTCPVANLEPAGRGPSACPSGSRAGPVGHVLGEVAFGREIVPEEATIESFYRPGGGLEFFTAGHSPVSLEILAQGRFVNLGGAGGYGPELVTQIPLVETVPGAQDASALRISLEVASARRVRGRPVYYGTVPKRGQCPRGGFKVKAEFTFAGLGGLAQTTVPVTFRTPCPKR